MNVSKERHLFPFATGMQERKVILQICSDLINCVSKITRQIFKEKLTQAQNLAKRIGRKLRISSIKGGNTHVDVFGKPSNQSVF